MVEHPLVEFIYSEFGKPLGDLLLVGYGSAQAGRKESFEFNAPRGGGDVRRWAVDVTGGELLSGNEPLVLAALLKFLLFRVDHDNEMYVSDSFEFNMQNLLREVRRDGRTSMSPEEAHQTIEKYVRLSYTLREVEPGADLAQARSRTVALHTFLSSYTYYFEREDYDAEPVRLINRVRINKEFVEGLKCGRLLFAGMELGERAPS
jgi:hypothetical protein